MPVTRSKDTNPKPRRTNLNPIKAQRKKKETQLQDGEHGEAPPKPIPGYQQHTITVFPTGNNDDNSNVAIDAPTTKAPKLVRKRGRKVGTISQDDTNNTPTTQKQGDTDNDANSPINTPTAHGPEQLAPAITPRKPRSERQKKAVHPTGQPTIRRTSEQVAADREAKKRAIEEKIWEGERAKQMLAQMFISEEDRDQEMQSENPQRLSAAIHERRRAVLTNDDSDGEHFNFSGVGAESDTESRSSEQDLETVPAKRKAVSQDLYILDL